MLQLTSIEASPPIAISDVLSRSKIHLYVQCSDASNAPFIARSLLETCLCTFPTRSQALLLSTDCTFRRLSWSLP